jgi:hypothetical protein
MSHKIKSFKEWQKKKEATENQADPEVLFEEIRNMVCTAFSTNDTDTIMEKVSEYGRAKFNKGVDTLGRKLRERV